MKYIYTFLFLAIAAFAKAQTPDSATVDTSWKSGGFISINTSQVGLTNWAAGGQNSFAFGGMLGLFANYLKGDKSWSNSLTLGYAVLQAGKATTKSDDRIDLVTKYGKRMFGHWYLTALANFKSQFANGFNYPNDSVVVSHFMAPGYALIALGMDYKPNDHFSFFISPATGRFVFVNDIDIADRGIYGNDPAVYDPNTGALISHGKRSRSEFGAYVKIAYKHDIMQNVTFAGRVDLFNNYTDKDANDRKNVVVNGEALIDMKVNKYISANFYIATIYDNAVDTQPDSPGFQRRLQVKDVIGVGFSYKF